MSKLYKMVNGFDSITGAAFGGGGGGGAVLPPSIRHTQHTAPNSLKKVKKPKNITNGFDAVAFNKKAMANNLDSHIYGKVTASSLNENQEKMNACMKPFKDAAMSILTPSNLSGVKKLAPSSLAKNGLAAVAVLQQGSAHCIATTSPKFLGYK